MAGTVKVKQVVRSKSVKVTAPVPLRPYLNGWFDSKHAEVDSPDYKGATVSATSTLLGFEDGELATPITLYGTTLSYTVNAEQNRIDFTGAGVLVGILFGGVRFSLANGICALGGDDRELELENVTWDGYSVTDFTMAEDLGVVKVGLVYVVNNASGEAQVEV